MQGLIGRKIGMTSIFDQETRKNIPCTVLEAGPCTVTQVKTEETDGYKAVQFAFGSRKVKNVSNALQGHLKKSKIDSAEKIVEYRDHEGDVSVGDVLAATDVFEEGEFVDVVGKSKGKGFQGVVKRYNFAGVGGQTHGQHNRQRHPGSIGAASYPSRVFKGMRMAGRTGNDRVMVENLQILKVIPEKNLIIVNGSVPGANNSIVLVQK